MIVVLSVEYAETDRDVMQRTIFPSQVPVYSTEDGPEEMPSRFLEVENIVGKEFVNEKGQRVMLGMSEDVQNLIGLPFRVFRDQEKVIDSYRNMNETFRKSHDALHQSNINLSMDNDILRNKLNFYRNMSFWQRLRFLFKIW